MIKINVSIDVDGCRNCAAIDLTSEEGIVDLNFVSDPVPLSLMVRLDIAIKEKKTYDELVVNGNVWKMNIKYKEL